jgi:hypothetical protein
VSRLRGYILAHWRGEQSLLRSCLVNGLVIGSAWNFCAGFSGPMLLHGAVHYCNVSGAAICKVEWSRQDYEAYVLAPLVTLLPLPWAVWAYVGIFRAGRRAAFDGSKSRQQRRVGFAAMATVGLFAAWWVFAVGNFIYGEKQFAELGVCRTDRHSPECNALLTAMTARFLKGTPTKAQVKE